MAVGVGGCAEAASEGSFTPGCEFGFGVSPGVFSRELKPGEEICACEHWTAFVATLDQPRYGRITVETTVAGRFVCSDPDLATLLCSSLHTAATEAPMVEVDCDGHQWRVVDCGGPDVTVDGFPCACAPQAAEVHPCNGIVLGEGQMSCGAFAQTVDVVCEPTSG